MTSTPATVSAPDIDAYALFWAFSLIALSGFGGVLPFAYRGLVEKRAWLSPSEFAEFLGLSQMLPGPTICNIAIMVGHKYRGMRGAFAALAGMICFPFLLVIALGALYQRYGDLPAVRDALHGMAAVAAGLIFATAVKMGMALYRKKEPRQRQAVRTGLLLLAFIGLGLAGWRLIWVFGSLATIGTALFYLMREKP
ncbi:chromate transporter [Noviherbaspirillum humi]|uniref:chromate transporter n=1 Tax=Noviherbaspirillum humi TaxID=1688639 RepID=UPI001FEA13B3|nr:chromate transporter [Noviherbaspirillum humi]